MALKQSLSLRQNQTILPNAVDIQDFTLGCGRTAERLFKKYDGDIEKIEEELEKENIDGNTKEEILWAIRWLKG